MENGFRMIKEKHPAKQVLVSLRGIRVAPYFEMRQYSFYKPGDSELIRRRWVFDPSPANGIILYQGIE